MVGIAHLGGRNMFEQCQFHFQRRVGCGGHQSQTVAYTEDVGVDG